MDKFVWTAETMNSLYELRTKTKLSWMEIAKKLNHTKNAMRCKYRDTNWELFLKNPDSISRVMWSDDDKANAYKLWKQKIPTPKIARILGRTTCAVVKIINRTDWDSFFKTYSKKKQKNNIVANDVIKSAYIDNLTRGIIELSRHNPVNLKNLTKQQFKSKIIIEGTLPISFTELKKRALYELEQIGFSYQSTKVFGEGTYIIVGDTHGKHTRSGVFKLVQNLSNHIQANRIIHVGHYIDDDNDHNFNWDSFKNLTIIAKEEELKLLAKKSLPHEIIRKEIVLGEKLIVVNQDLISDYIQTPLSKAITPEFFESSTICNLHRHEFDTRCTEKDSFSCVASPGCLCEPHIVSTIKQQDFTDGRTVKLTIPSGYKKYRRMQHMFKTWQQGIVVVHIDKSGDFSIYLCRIHKTSKGFTTSYFDKIITEDEILDPNVKTFINSDLHSDYHDINVLDIQDQIVKDYKPDNYACLGDMNENRSINHHVFKQYGCMRVENKILHESATTNYLLYRMAKWARRTVLLLGNHERFYTDFTDKFPQFSEILDFNFINGIQDLNIEIINLKQMKKISNMNLVHGNLQLFGQKGGLFIDKLFRTYGRNTVMGHTHYPSCRNDCYTVGLTGKLNLEYNEDNASKWVHGIMLANSFENVAFLTNVCIVNNKCFLNKKCYTPKNSSSWKVPRFKAKLVYTFCE
jgi:hypothetical protein